MHASAALVDSGPLYALFDRRDPYHRMAKEVIRDFRGRLISNLAVMQEVHILLDFDPPSQQAFLAWMHAGPVDLEPITKDDLGRLHALIGKYQEIPMDFADGALVVQAERLGLDRILTVDSDFTIYRLKRSQPFTNLFPLT